MATAPPSITFLACPECSGRGFLIEQRGKTIPCPRCGSVGTVSVVDGELLAYREQYSRASLKLERLHGLARAIVDGAFVVFGLVGFLVGLLEFRAAQSTFGSFEEFFLLQTPGMFVFWLSLLGDLYVFYRLEQESARPKKLRDQRRILEAPPESFESIGNQPVLDVATAFSRGTRTVVKHAWEMADRLGHRAVADRHLFSALLSQPVIMRVLLRLGVPHKAILGRATRLLQSVEKGAPSVFGPMSQQVFAFAYQEARAKKSAAIEPLDLLIALGQVDGEVHTLFEDLGIDSRKLRNVVEWMRIDEELRHRWGQFRARAAFKPKGIMDRAMLAQATPVLDQFSHDLTAIARAGALALTVDREQEISAVFRALEGKSNAVLVGNPGVGKTAIIEGIAARMVAEDVPDALQDKRLVSLSVASLVSGAGAIGELEQRFTEILTEVVKSGNIILFIDNIQNLVGVSSTGGQSMDLSGILAQALATKRFFALATTTVGDYTHYIERSGALMTTFEKVEVPEMDRQATILVLEAKAGQIEYKNKVFLSYEAVEKTVEYAERYIHERFQPQKSIDLLDEVAIGAHRKKGKGCFVTEDDVAAVVSEKTRIEVRKVTQDESEKLMHLEERMHGRIVGQDEAVKAVAGALRRARAELRDPNRPIATFLFLGPTGVGKTELAKTVAETYFGSEKAMIRLDMSEYQDPASLYRMIGAPPGYGGGEGYLTEAIRRNPFTLVLLDELEKAHSDILNVFLQVFDDGRLTDSTGRTVDFTNAIIIATSNAGTDVIQQRMKEGAGVEAIKDELINDRLGQYFRPEFLNRFDGIIVFKPLTQPEIEQITGLLLKKIAASLTERGITLQATPEAVAELAAAGFDPVFGARPLRRAIQENVDNALANFLLTGKLGRRDVAVLEAGGVIRVEKARAV